jgi:glycosyltransferase involved in cell wall biosynthesis
MRIAQISTCALATPPRKYGGTELVAAELAKGLTELGHDVTTFATGNSRVCGELRYHFARNVWPPDLDAEREHAEAAWREILDDPIGFDVVHVHSGAALHAPGADVPPTVLTIHHKGEEPSVQRYRDRTDIAFVAVSNSQSSLLPEVRFARTVHHGLDPDAYPAGDGRGDYLAFVGRFSPEKVPHIAIDAARAVGMRLMLGGEAQALPEAQAYYEREMRPRLARATDLQWCGEVGHEHKVRILRSARALLLPLDCDEPFGLVIVEAMLVGCPVIAFARGSAPEVVEDGVTGFLVRDQAEMVARIGQLDRIDRRRCRARAIERWSTLRMASDYARLYAELAEPNQRRRSGVVTGVSPERGVEIEHGAQVG